MGTQDFFSSLLGADSYRLGIFTGNPVAMIAAPLAQGDRSFDPNKCKLRRFLRWRVVVATAT
ncbi:hypothetical protein JSE7799_03210 [Jannaschia seosinensis]|uniref:Uncharacterized protein n=1 Tax=Jannaschia seosinensis TaxID=313367 RepID=A0A0M7BCF0_9RHOB|nr:hypothetical protein JSE7799_03210 [Jannaschia seosinensis]